MRGRRESRGQHHHHDRPAQELRGQGRRGGSRARRQHRCRPGEVFGFLGPNGAGKTTTLRMVTTLLPIDAGTATVAGYDVARQPQEVRSRVGYVSQLGGADDLATGRENLILQGRLYGGDLASVRSRAQLLMEILD